MIVIGRWVLLVLLLASIASARAADAYDAATQTAIQTIITRQLDAIAHDDAAGAASFASNGIRKKFPEPATFLAMVKASYAALIKPRRTHFDEISAAPQGPMQKVTILAADGTIWTALYAFEKADDGGWRIIGCSLEQEKQQDI